MLNVIELRIQSNWVNVINFVIFDVVLISLIFYLTADVMGRYNDSTLRDGEPRRLFIACPPVLGGGLCTTRRATAFFLLFVRFIGLGLIFMTNLTITGQERTEIYTAEEYVLSYGTITHFTEKQFVDAMLTRSGCMGNRPPAKNEGNSTIVYYGELRGEKSDECIVNRTLMSVAPIEFSSKILLRNMSTGEPGEKCTSRTRTMRNRTAAEYFCSKAVLSCFIRPSWTLPDFDTCRGLVRHENETYICEEGAAKPEMELEPTHARWVRGLDYRSTEWLDAIFVSPAWMNDAIDATFGARTERRRVLKTRERQWTLVRPLWLVALAFKVALVAILGFTSFSLKRAGFRTVAHDEQRLAELLRTSLQENVHPGRRWSEQKDAEIFLNAAESEDGLLIFADLHARKPQRASNVQQRRQAGRRNTELHRVEEMHF